MEELLPILIIAVALILRARKANKETEEGEVSPSPPFPRIPMPGFPPQMPAPGEIAPRETEKSAGTFPKKPRDFSEKVAVLPASSPAPPARMQPRPEGTAAPPRPQKQEKQAESYVPLSLSTPEEARKAFLYSEIFQRKY